MPSPAHGAYPIAFVACGDPGALPFAIRALAAGGICTSATFYFSKGTRLPLWEMCVKSLTFTTGWALPSVHLTKILKRMDAGRFDPGAVTRQLADWDVAADAFLEPGTKIVARRERAFAP